MDPKSCRPTLILMPGSRHAMRKSFVRLLPLGQSYFGPIFEFGLLKIVGRPPSPVWCGLANLGHTQARVKTSGDTTP